MLWKLFSYFGDPLAVSLSAIMDEIEDTIDYARQYLALESTSYRRSGIIFTFVQIVINGRMY